MHPGQETPSVTAPAPIDLNEGVLSDLPIRWDYGRLFDLIVSGRSVVIHDRSHYMNIYVHYRQKKNALPMGQILTCRKVGETKWIVGMASRDAAKESSYRGDYDTRYGRLKRQAEELQNGNPLRLPTWKEAKYAAHAWRIYTPKAKREHLRSTIHEIDPGKAYLVVIKPKGN